ncbi:MAG TPA: sulfotransferase domain-containing protein [Casimicrobiaceae bacterium]|nr:sulfotransferase domain-containing protein [Casimicrobiaceae bacterium]
MPQKPPLEIDAQQLLYAVVNAAVGNGLAPTGEVDFAADRAEKPLVVVAAAPKSGSTFLANTLRAITGLRNFRLCAAYSTNEHDLYLPALCLMSRYGCVSQLHMKGSFHNAELMRTFGIRPVILVRRIEDIVVSLQHDLERKAKRPTVGTGQEGYSFVWQDQCTRELAEERRLDFVIDLAIPWFVNFYVSWHRLCEQGAVDALWVTYEEMVAGTEDTLRKILAFLGLDAQVAIPADVLGRKYHTFRDGRVGQGRAALSEEQQRRLRQRFEYYPDIDFGRYGL